MADQENVIMFRLLKLRESTGYDIVQENGQRRFGPPPNWAGPPPPKGCEVFVGKLPRQLFEDELVPIFSKVGKIYDLRLMMDFSGSNRGFAFVTYTRREDASAAIREFDGFEIRPGRYIGVVKSVDNCRLFFGGIPQAKAKEDVYGELSKRVSGIVDVIVYKNCFDRRRNRGFAFVEFVSHRAAAMARRALAPGVVRLWDQDVVLDWAEPEPSIDDDLMKQVKVLFVRNFFIGTTSETIKNLFESAINARVEKVKKLYDYAFIHFIEREHAELAMAKLQNVEIDGSNIEIRLAKPVDHDLYRIQKNFKGNAKFNKNMDLTETLLLYKQHFDQREFEKVKENGEPNCGFQDAKTSHVQNKAPEIKYSVAPAKLEAMCTAYGWTLPVYKYQKYVDQTGTVIWIGHVELPSVGLPLLTVPCPVGPLVTRACISTAQARVDAAGLMLRCIKDVAGMVGGGGVSVYYSHTLKMLFFSYAHGRSYLAPLSTVEDSVKGTALIPQSLATPPKEGGRGGGKQGGVQALCQWAEVPGHPGMVTAVLQASNNPVVLMLTPNNIFIQEIKVVPAKAKITDMVAVRHWCGGGGEQKSTLILLCEDGSLRMYAASPEHTGFWLSPTIQPTHAPRRRPRALTHHSKGKAQQTASKSNANGSPQFPIDFFEHCVAMSDVEFGGKDLLQVYNTAQIKHRLNTTGLYVVSTKMAGFSIEVMNSDPNMVICGIRVLLGSQDVARTPTYIEVLGRTIPSVVLRNRWFDMPLTREESLQSDKKVTINFGPSQDPDGICMVDSVKVYGKNKEQFGWPEENEDPSSCPSSSKTTQETEGNTGAWKPSSLERLACAALEALELGAGAPISALAAAGAEGGAEAARKLLCAPASAQLHARAQCLLRAVHHQHYHQYKDQAILNYVCSSLRELRATHDARNIDPEAFFRLVLLARGVAVARPAHLVKYSAPTPQRPADGDWSSLWKSDPDDTRDPHVCALLTSVLWRLAACRSAAGGPPGVLSYGLRHVEHTLHALADTVHAFQLHAEPDCHSDWSVEWSTGDIPAMDNAAGSANTRRVRGRQRLRNNALALGFCLTIHSRVAAPALTTGLLYYPFLIASVVVLANPMRHFEMYLGQWSINGPGRAFRILRMLDGIGIAMCINCLVRAMNCCAMAAIAMLYVVHASSDAKLPFTQCRDWQLKTYDPVKLNISSLDLDHMTFTRRRSAAVNAIMLEQSNNYDPYTQKHHNTCSYTVGLHHLAAKKENVELVKLRPTYDYRAFNIPILICLSCIWGIMWLFMIAERLTKGRLVWNNLFSWIMCVPCIWVICLTVVATCSVSQPLTVVKQLFNLGCKDIFMSILDALVAALYIHSASTGTELILGKGLNVYASGHIDPLLNYDNVWHSGLLLALAVLHSLSTAVCGLSGIMHTPVALIYNTRESFLWMMPMYSKCTSLGNYSHAMSCIIFGGLSFSYIVVAYTMFKTALHTIFEYRVKLVFIEQWLVAALVCICFLASLPYATTGGLPLLESVDAIMTGIALPLLCFLELVALMYVYRSPDFQSDINLATEDNTCNTRISTSWHILPLIIFAVLIAKVWCLTKTELPGFALGMASLPLVATVLALPLRALHNAFVFLHPAPRHGV